jgi:hypothetical protein
LVGALLLRTASDAATSSNFLVSANLLIAASLSSFRSFIRLTTASAQLKSRMGGFSPRAVLAIAFNTLDHFLERGGRNRCQSVQQLWSQ